MYIVYVVGHSSETVVFEEKKDACEYAIGVAKELGTEANVYKASLVAQATMPTEPVLVKVKKQKFASPEVFKPAVEKIVKKYTKPVKATPPVDPVLSEIAEDTSQGDGEVPLGARCELDSNMAVGKRKGPTGEFVYLCVDCMGALA